MIMNYIPIMAAIVLFAVLAIYRPGVALIGSFLATLVLMCWFFHVEMIGPGIASGLVVLMTMTTILISRPNVERASWPQEASKISLIAVASILAVGVWFVLGGIRNPAGWMFLLLLVGTNVGFILASRRAVAHYVLSTLAGAMRQNLPLADSLNAAAAGANDKRSRILRRIARRLEEGMPVSMALKWGYFACPGHAIGALAAAERVGQVPRALQRIEDELVRDVRRRHAVRAVRPWYPLLLILALGLICSGFQLFIIPSFMSIFDDMGEKLPWATQALVGFFSGQGSLLLQGIVLLMLVAAPIALYTQFRPRRPGRPAFWSRVGDFVKWRLPLAHWFERARSTSRAAAMLRLSLEAGCTVDDAIESTLELDLNGTFRSRLRLWLGRVRRGEDVSAAALASGAGRPFSWAFDQQANPNNAPQALAVIESSFRAAHNYRARLASVVFWPMVVLSLAVMVGFVVYALFVPLVELINAMMRGMLP